MCAAVAAVLRALAPPRLPCSPAPAKAAQHPQCLQAMASPEAAGSAAPAQVAVITTLGCPYCKKAKAALQVRREGGRCTRDGRPAAPAHAVGQ